jgi:adenylylsulfate kinase-like enzyme
VQGAVIWCVGLSGAGKSTLCNAIRRRLAARGAPVVVLDGDAVREAFDNDLGYGEADRARQVGRLQRLAALLAEQRLVVLVAAVFSRPDLLAWNRERLPHYVEVYLRAPLASLEARDPKGIYARYRAGALQNLVGLDVRWHEPHSPDVTFDAVSFAEPDEMARRVLARLPADAWGEPA